MRTVLIQAAGIVPVTRCGEVRAASTASPYELEDMKHDAQLLSHAAMRSRHNRVLSARFIAYLDTVMHRVSRSGCRQ